MTESGKTTLATLLNRELKSRGMETAILDPMEDQRWEQTVYTDPGSFLSYVKERKSLVCFVDEGGQSIGRWKEWTDEMVWLATTSRHYGHSCFFISQRVVQMDSTIRHQCTRAYLFGCGELDLKTFAEEWRQPDLILQPRLEPWEFYIVHRFRPLQRGRVDITKGMVYNHNERVVSGRSQQQPETVG